MGGRGLKRAPSAAQRRPTIELKHRAGGHEQACRTSLRAHAVREGAIEPQLELAEAFAGVNRSAAGAPGWCSARSSFTSIWLAGEARVLSTTRTVRSRAYTPSVFSTIRSTVNCSSIARRPSSPIALGLSGEPSMSIRPAARRSGRPCRHERPRDPIIHGFTRTANVRRDNGDAERHCLEDAGVEALRKGRQAVDVEATE